MTWTAYDRDKDDADARVIGRAFAVSGVGFWASIEGILALSPDLQRVTGVVFLRHSETPGLGGRITERQFRDQFRRGLRATPPDAGGQYIYIGGAKPAGPGDPRWGRRVDAVSGATGTSTAVERFLNADLARFRAAVEAEGLIDKESGE